MRPRIAGVLTSDTDFLQNAMRLWAERSAPSHGHGVQLFSFPEERPLLGVVIAEGCQPRVQSWRAADGSFAVLDGEIYNAEEFRRQTPAEGTGHDNHARLALELFRRHGAAGLARLDAAAGIVIWDASRGELHLFRDRAGAVPVFHAERGDGLVFASDIESLLAVGIPRSLDMEALDFFLARGFTLAPWSFIEQVRKISPGHVLSKRIGHATSLAYYHRPTGRPKQSPSAAARTDRLRELFVQAVRRRYTPGPGTAVLLSSGFDSTLVLGCLTQLVGAEVDAFTFDYTDYQGIYNEGAQARSTAAQLGVRHHMISCRPIDVADSLPRLVAEYGQPFTYGLHSFMLGELTKAGIHTVLTGAGVGGAIVTKRGLASIWFQRLPGPARALARMAWPAARPFMRRSTPGIEWILWAEANNVPVQCAPNIMAEPLRQSIYLDRAWFEAGRKASLQRFLTALDELRGEDPFDQSRIFDQWFFEAENIVYWNTVWARSYDLLIRHPNLDNDLLEFQLLLDGNLPGKKYQQQFAATILPAALANRPKTHQTIPIGHWFRGPLRNFLYDSLASTRLRDGGLFRADVVMNLIEEHVQGKADHTWRLWTLIAFLAWQDAVLKKPPRSHVNA